MRISKHVMISLFIFLFATLPLTQICFSKERSQSSLFEESTSPDRYPVVYYNFNGLTYSKEVKLIPANQAEEIIDQFENIDNTYVNHSENIQRKHDVLAANNLVLDHDLGDSSLEYPVEDGRNIGLFFSKLTGIFGPCSINLLSVFFTAPFFISRAHGISVHISGTFYPSFDFVSFQLINIRILGFIGLLIVFPFLSIGGYIDGVAFMGRIQEI